MREEILMTGSGGQGVMIMGQLLTHAAMMEGNHVVWFPTYGPEARGGTAECTVILSTDEIGSPISSRPDTLIGMHDSLFRKYVPTVKQGGRLVVNSSLIDISTLRDDCTILAVAANTIAEEIGNVRAANMVVLGAYVSASGILQIESLVASLAEILPAHRRNLIPLNEMAIRRGAQLIGT